LGHQPFGDVVVVVPGIGGSVLRDERGRDLWTVRARRILPALARFVRGKDRLQLPVGMGDSKPRDGVQVAGLLSDLHALPGFWTIDGYRRCVDTLTKRFEIERPANGRPGNLIEFAYDWRLSNRYNGRRLAEQAAIALDQWQREGHPHAKLVIVGHSMGGLVARWFLDVEGGHALTRRLITIGTPYQGSLKALGVLTNGFHKCLGPLRVDLTDLLRSFPSVHQLLPGFSCLWAGSEQSLGSNHLRLRRLQDLDTTLPALAGLPAGAVADAVAFHHQLAEGADAHAGAYRLYALKGHLQPTDQAARCTPTGVDLDDLEDGRFTYTKYTDDGGLEPLVNARGDGTVPRGSSHPPDWPDEENTPTWGRVQGFATAHSHLQNADALLDSLYQILTADRLGRTAGLRQIGVRVPDVAGFDEPIVVEVIADETADNLPLGVWVDLAETSTYVENLGGGHYRAELPPLPPDAHTITVASQYPANPIEPVDRIVTIVGNPFPADQDE
jgi:pimeloyl-ACP methyl ester carboxylesterase